MATSALTVTTVKTCTHEKFHANNASYKPTSSSSSCCCLPKATINAKLTKASNFDTKKCVLDVGIGVLAASIVAFSPLEANATRIEYYATVADPPCDLNFVSSGLGYCDVSPGTGQEAPYGELINVSCRFLSIGLPLPFQLIILIV